MKKKYQHIFFDLDNTLWDFEKNAFYAMEITFNHFLPDKSIKFEQFFDVYSKNNRFLWNEYRDQNVSKKELINKRFGLTFKTLNILNVVPEEMNEFYLKEMPKQNHLNEGAMEVIHYLKQKRYSLHIVTNGFRNVQFKKLESSGLMPFFNNIFISEDIKTPKPGFEFFETAIKSSNAKKKESLMIGDDWEVDVLGAINFGIDSVYYSKKSHPSMENMADAKKRNTIYTINKLTQLSQIL